MLRGSATWRMERSQGKDHGRGKGQAEIQNWVLEGSVGAFLSGSPMFGRHLRGGARMLSELHFLFVLDREP